MPLRPSESALRYFRTDSEQGLIATSWMILIVIAIIGSLAGAALIWNLTQRQTAKQDQRLAQAELLFYDECGQTGEHGREVGKFNIFPVTTKTSDETTYMHNSTILARYYDIEAVSVPEGKYGADFNFDGDLDDVMLQRQTTEHYTATDPLSHLNDHGVVIQKRGDANAPFPAVGAALQFPGVSFGTGEYPAPQHKFVALVPDVADTVHKQIVIHEHCWGVR